MNYRKLGKTGLMVSEIGFGPEWMTGTPEETRAIAEVLREAGVNYLDCWMPDPHIRANLGYAMKSKSLVASTMCRMRSHAFTIRVTNVPICNSV